MSFILKKQKNKKATNSVSLVNLNKKKRTLQLPQIFSRKRNSNPNRNELGQFTTGSGGINLTQFKFKRAIPLIIVVALAGGYLVFTSSASKAPGGGSYAFMRYNNNKPVVTDLCQIDYRINFGKLSRAKYEPLVRSKVNEVGQLMGIRWNYIGTSNLSMKTRNSVPENEKHIVLISFNESWTKDGSQTGLAAAWAMPRIIAPSQTNATVASRVASADSSVDSVVGAGANKIESESLVPSEHATSRATSSNVANNSVLRGGIVAFNTYRFNPEKTIVHLSHELGHIAGLADLYRKGEYNPKGVIDRTQLMGSAGVNGWQNGDKAGLRVAGSKGRDKNNCWKYRPISAYEPTVRAGYGAVLGRIPEKAGGNYFAGNLQSGFIQRPTFVRQLMGSKESLKTNKISTKSSSNAWVKAAYKNALCRQPSANDIKFWTNRAKTKGMQTVLLEIGSSAEAKAKQSRKAPGTRICR